MRPHQFTIIAGVACLIALLIPPLVYRQVRFESRLKDAEKAVAAFKPSELQIPAVAWQPVLLRLPVTQPQQQAAATAVPGRPTVSAPVAAAPAPQPTVSFILSDGGNGMAIINGAVVREGDRYQQWHVIRIERNRVLLNGRKGPLWLTLQ